MITIDTGHELVRIGHSLGSVRESLLKKTAGDMTQHDVDEIADTLEQALHELDSLAGRP